MALVMQKTSGVDPATRLANDNKQKGRFYKLVENTWEQVLTKERGHPERLHEVFVGRRFPPP